MIPEEYSIPYILWVALGHQWAYYDCNLNLSEGMDPHGYLEGLP